MKLYFPILVALVSCSGNFDSYIVLSYNLNCVFLWTNCDIINQPWLCILWRTAK